jgi:PAS domain S-box-containing protein
VYTKDLLEDRLRAVISVGFFSVFRMNAAWTEMLSLEGHGPLAGLACPHSNWLIELIPPSEQKFVIESVTAGMSNDLPLELDHPIIAADQTIGWVRTRAVAIRTVDNDIIEWFGTMTDITELKEEDERQRFLLAWSDRINPLATPQCVMQASAEMLGEFLRAGRVRYIEMDDGSMVYSRSAEWVNEGLNIKPIDRRFTLAQFASTLVEKVKSGRALVTMDVREDPDTMPQADLFEANQVRSGILVPLIKDGKLSGALSVHMPDPRRWRSVEVRLVEEVAGRTWSAVQRAKAEARLMEATASMKLAFDVVNMVPWQLTLPERMIIQSRSLRGNAVFSTGNPVPLVELMSSVHPADNALFLEAVDRCIESRSTLDVEYRFVTEGVTSWIRTTGRWEGTDGREYLVGVSQDITDRKQAEEQRRLDSERLKLIFDSAHDYAIIALDAEGRITSWNSGAERILGYTEEEALGAQDAILFTEEDISFGVPDMEKRLARDTGRAENERWHLRKDGTSFWASGQMVPLQNGHQEGYLKIFRDLTEKKQAEERLALLVDELNHRVKNTLSTVQSICRQTLRLANVPDDVQRQIADRLQALASSHDLLTREHWTGAPIAELVEKVLAPFRGGVAPERIVTAGPSLLLTPKAALALTIALHELGSNALKYGSLGPTAGNLSLLWGVSETTLTLDWRETGTGARMRERRGFGSRILEDALAHELDAEVTLNFGRDGLHCRLDIPLEGNVR